MDTPLKINRRPCGAGLNNFLTAVESSSVITDPQEFQDSIRQGDGHRFLGVERNHTRLRHEYLRQDPLWKDPSPSGAGVVKNRSFVQPVPG